MISKVPPKLKLLMVLCFYGYFLSRVFLAEASDVLLINLEREVESEVMISPP